MNTGLVVADAYHKIIGIRIDERRGISISVAIWKDEGARLAGNVSAIHSESLRFPFKHEEITGETLYQYAYGKLKLLDQYKDAVDV